MVKVKRFEDGGFVWVDLDAPALPPGVEKRKEERKVVRLPARLSGRSGYFATNLADSAVHLETANTHAVGELVSLEVEIEMPEGRRLLLAEGQIRRVDSSGSRSGVVVQLISRRLQPVEQ